MLRPTFATGSLQVRSCITMPSGAGAVPVGAGIGVGGHLPYKQHHQHHQHHQHQHTTTWTVAGPVSVFNSSTSVGIPCEVSTSTVTSPNSNTITSKVWLSPFLR